MRICNNCGEELPPSAKFCVNCGKLFEAATSEKSQDQDESVSSTVDDHHRSSESGQLTHRIRQFMDEDNFLPMIAIIGIAIILLSLVSILGLSSIQFNFAIYTTILLGAGSILCVTGLVLLLTNKSTVFTQTLLIITGEILIIATIWLIDLEKRSSFTREVFLWATISFFIIGLVLPELKDLKLIGKVWQLGSTYLAFITIIQSAGSTYYSRLEFSIALILVVLAINFIIIIRRNVYLIFWGLPLEFFTLLTNNVINATLLVPTSLLIILPIPLLLIKFYPEERIITIYDISIYELMLLLPQLAMVFVVTNGSLESPWPELIVAAIIGVWALYYLIGRYRKVDQRTEEHTAIMSIQWLVAIAIVGFAISNQLSTTIVLLAFLHFQNMIETRTNDSYLNALITSMVSIISPIILVSINHIDLLLIFGPICLIVLARLLVGHYLKKQDRYRIDLIFIFMIVATLSGFFLYQEYEIWYILPINTIFQLVGMWYLLKSSKVIPIISALFISIPALLAINQSTLMTYQWAILLSQSLAIGAIFFFDSRVDHLVTTSILSLPIIFLQSSISNLAIFNYSLAILIILALIFQIKVTNGLDQQVLSSALFLVAVFLRAVVTTETSSWYGLSMELLTYSTILTIFSFILGYQYLRHGDNQFNFIILATWTTIASLLITELRLDEYDFAASVVFFAVSAVILASGILRLGQSQTEILTHLLPSSLILMIFTVIQFSLAYAEIVLFVLLLNQLYNLYRKRDDDVEKLVLVSWSILLLTNIYLLSINGQIWLVLAMVVLFGVFLYDTLIVKFITNIIDAPEPVRLLITTILLFITGIYAELGILNIKAVIAYSTLTFIMILLHVFSAKKEMIGSVYATQLALTTLFYTQIGIDFVPMFVLSSVAILGCFLLDPSISNKITTSKVFEFNLQTLSLIICYLTEIILLGSTIIIQGWINFLIFNQILVGVAIFSFLLATLIERKSGRTILTQSILLLGAFTFVITNFIGFYDQIISNILFVTIAMIIALVAVISKRRDIMLIALSLSVLSVIKAFIDLLTLSTFLSSLSWLMVGMELVMYGVIFSNIKMRDLKLPDQN